MHFHLIHSDSSIITGALPEVSKTIHFNGQKFI
jgi:hypothetical protein